jgi:hypothetical protein
MTIKTLPWELNDLCCDNPSLHKEYAEVSPLDVSALNQGVNVMSGSNGRDVLPQFNLDMDQELAVLWALEDGVEIYSKDEQDNPKVPHILMSGDAIVFLPHRVDLKASCGKLNFSWLSCCYHGSYLRQRTNFFQLVPPAKALTLSPPMQRILGYSMPVRFFRSFLLLIPRS